MLTDNADNVEDILSDALQLIDENLAKESRTIDEERVQYGDLVLRVAPKEGKALTLLADQLFSPSLVLAEQIERRQIDLRGRSVLELGAGCAVPSLLSATLPPSDSPSLVVITDYPDADIIANLRGNVDVNQSLLTEGCDVRVEGYEWGDIDTAHRLRTFLPKDSPGYDTLILSDLLHFDSSHTHILNSVCALLSPKPTTTTKPHSTPIPQVHVAAGRYTPPPVCIEFLNLGIKRGFKWTEILLHDTDTNSCTWKGKLTVSSPLGRPLSPEELARRKENCRYWIGEWM